MFLQPFYFRLERECFSLASRLEAREFRQALVQVRCDIPVCLAVSLAAVSLAYVHGVFKQALSRVDSALQLTPFPRRRGNGQLRSERAYFLPERQYLSVGRCAPDLVFRELPGQGRDHEFRVTMSFRRGGIACERPFTGIPDPALHGLGAVAAQHTGTQLGEDLIDGELRGLAGNAGANDLDERVSEVGQPSGER